MKPPETFSAPSGNVALITCRGSRGKLDVVDVAWHRNPSRKDLRSFRAWFQSNYAHLGKPNYFHVPTSEGRRQLADSILFGGSRN